MIGVKQRQTECLSHKFKTALVMVFSGDQKPRNDADSMILDIFWSKKVFGTGDMGNQGAVWGEGDKTVKVN